MPDNRRLGALGLAKVLMLVAMLVVPVALLAVPVTFSDPDRTAWLKLVTPSWNGVVCPSAPVSSTPQMRACPDPAFTGFADRYNLTSKWYWVEVYHERGSPFNDAIGGGKYYPNGTGFVRISWPDAWPNVTVVVKAKSYDGTEIGAGSLYRGIIVYSLVINASGRYLSLKTGIPIGNVFDPPDVLDGRRHNATVLMTGNAYIVPYGDTWSDLLSNAESVSRSGPVDMVALHPEEFSEAFGDPRNAWVANASVIFKHFHVHTWYSFKDNLSYAQVKIYDINHTSPSSGASLLRAFVTKGDGSGNSLYDPRTTGEMSPSHDRYEDNELVPIPLQAVNLERKTAYMVFTGSPTNKWAHLNVTVRVWWESVLVNTTFYVGTFNFDNFPTVGSYLTIPTTIYRIPVTYPDSPAGVTLMPLNIYYNFSTQRYVELDPDYPPGVSAVGPGTSNFLNSTVFYWRCGVRDDDLLVNGEDDSLTYTDSALFDAQCLVNLRDRNSNVYHTLHERGSTGEDFLGDDGQAYALSDDPHDWPGYLPDFRAYLRAPNATVWPYLYAKFSGISIDGTRAADLVYVSKYYSGTTDLTQNKPSEVAINDDLKTRSVGDDPGPYMGIRLEVLYAGGYKNLYGGLKQTVGVYTLQNVYLIALKDLLVPIDTWPDPFAAPGNYPEIIGDRSPGPPTVKLGTSESGAPIVGIVDSNLVPPDAPLDDPVFGEREFDTDGKLLVVANVSDIVFAVYDNQGSLLTPPQTQIWLLRDNGAPVQLGWYRLEGVGDGVATYVRESEFVPFLYWVYVNTELFPDPAAPPTHIAVAYQVPEELMYGVIVKFDGVTVYQNEGEIDKLLDTQYVELTARVFKLKVLFVDCLERPLTNTPVWMIDPTLGTEVRFNTGPDGARDFVVPGDSITFTKLYWKGVDVPFIEAILPNNTKIPATEGRITIPATADIYAPIKVKALINDFVFKTWDFQGKAPIPRLNVTISWVGYNISDPAKKPWYFLETMDPRPYAISDGTLAERLGIVPTGEGAEFDAQRWNTSVRVAQFFSYVIQHKNMTNEYIFYQMPPALYNITVTTVVPIANFSDSASPGSGFWPGEDDDRTYEAVISWSPGSKSVLPVEVNEGAKTRVVLREFNKDLRFTTCGALTVDLKTWALHWFLEMIDGDLKIGDVSFDIVNDNFQSMTLDLGNMTKWDKLTLEYTTTLYGDNTRPGPQDYSYLWWNGSYRLEDVRLTTNMSFLVDKFYNGTAPNKVWPTLNFTLQPNATLHQQQTLYPDWVELQSDFGYKIIIYDKETLRAPLPVTFVKPMAIDKGGSELEGATVEAWILDLDTEASVDIDGADSGSGLLTSSVRLSWAWEKKQVADPDEPQRFKLVRWDRVMLTFSGVVAPEGERIPYEEDDDFEDHGLGVGDVIHFVTPANIHVDWEEYLTLEFHTAGIITVIEEYGTFGYTLMVSPGDVITFTGSFGGDGIDLGIPPSMRATIRGFSDPDYIWFHNDGELELLDGVPDADGIVTILVQVPPYPAKLYLRDVLEELDVVVTAKSVTALVDDPTERDHNVGADTPMATPDGLLAYAKFKTQANGLIKSFTVPGYEGLLLLPISGWLNETFHDDSITTVDEFHYQFNVVWKSAVVYSDNLVLDKKEVVFGASEVYDVRFMFTLSNSTAPADAVRNLNLWIYYPNVTSWHTAELWNEVPDKPQDYEACKDSAFPCELRVTLISAADPDGIVEFAKIPGPRFMNTTWKYVFSANHSAITWLEDLVATQFVLNNETFGDGPLKTVTTRSVTVPIMLNAAHQLQFLVLGWRDEQGIATAYPLQNFTVRYEIRRRDAGITVASGTAVSNVDGIVEVRSVPADPRKVLWAGLTVRYRVEPPRTLIDVRDSTWATLLRQRQVGLKEYNYEPDLRPSIGAYFPDEVPTHWAITEIKTDIKEDGFCYGLCTAFFPAEGRTRSKPYIINVDYTIVTVRALDFNGRPLAGAFVEIVERASGRVAGWSYTFNSTWRRAPIDLQRLYDFHEIKPLDPRIVGGTGYTEFIPVAVGKWNYDANNDDREDASGYRGDDPRTPSAEGTPLQFIVRVYWAATDPDPDNAGGDLHAIWPFIDPQKPFTTTEAGQPVRKYHVKVYDSDFDETDEAAKTLVVPIDSMVEIRKPSERIYKFDGKHRDVTTAVFDLKLLLHYEGKTLPDIIREQLEVRVFKKTGTVTELALTFLENRTTLERELDAVTVNRLPRGVYEVRVFYRPIGDAIFTRTFDISQVNVGTVQAEASLAFTDLSFEVTDLRGRPLPIEAAQVSVEPGILYYNISVAGNVVTIFSLYTGAPVTVTVGYTSPDYRTSADTRITDSADGFKTRLIGGRTLQLPVDDVTVTVVDRQGRPMGGAVVKLGQAPAKSTGGDGRAVFERVPLESAGRGITYTLSVTVGGVEVTPADARSVELSTARTSITVIGELFSLPVRVIGQLGQGLEGANVRVVKGAVTVASSSTDSGGFAQFDKLVLDTYTVVANYKGYSQEVSVSSADLQAGRVVEITLPIYTELLGIPMPLSTLLALIIGLILLVVVLAIIVSEYRWWRGRRLGVYPPAPPKAPK